MTRVTYGSSLPQEIPNPKLQVSNRSKKLDRIAKTVRSSSADFSPARRNPILDPGYSMLDTTWCAGIVAAALARCNMGSAGHPTSTGQKPGIQDQGSSIQYRASVVIDKPRVCCIIRALDTKEDGQCPVAERERERRLRNTSLRSGESATVIRRSCADPQAGEVFGVISPGSPLSRMPRLVVLMN